MDLRKIFGLYSSFILALMLDTLEMKWEGDLSSSSAPLLIWCQNARRWNDRYPLAYMIVL